MKILVIDEESCFLDDVIALGKANASTLGFLPRGAFKGHAASNQVLVALDEDNEVIGYLAYASSAKKRLAYIVHLCVKRSHRRRGIAKALFEKMRATTREAFRGIRVRCRRDFEASAVWPKLGFVAVDEMPGRSKHGTPVTLWWFDHGHPTLFSYADGQRAESRLKVAMDASVFFQLQEAPARANEESQSLLADWLQENIELCVTNEIFNEVDRHPNDLERSRARAFARSFFRLTSTEEEFQRAKQDLRKLFPLDMATSDESDLRQLAWSGAAGAGFFVTRDGELLAKESEVYEICGIRIVRPSDLIIDQDHLVRDSEYQPARLAGSQLKIERVQRGQTSSLEDAFRAPCEAKARFRQRLRPCLADPRTFETVIVESTAGSLALIVYGRQARQELEVPVFRTLRGSLSPTLSRYLVTHIVSVSAAEGRLLTKVSDPYLSDDAIAGLLDMGFVSADNSLLKASVPFLGTVEAFVSRLLSLSVDLPRVKGYFQQMADTLEMASAHGSTDVLLQVERALWPTKLVDLDLPAFVVPIRPQWAMHLFDPYIGGQDLFGGEPSLILNVENAYYRARHPAVLEAPARILWYVSRGTGKYQGTMAIRASSYLDEVVVGTPKALFSRFRRLGVYRWEDVLHIARNAADREIMAFRFSGTQLFGDPVGGDTLQRIWAEELNRRFCIRSPIAVSKECFFRVYRAGVGIE